MRVFQSKRVKKVSRRDFFHPVGLREYFFQGGLVHTRYNWTGDLMEKVDNSLLKNMHLSIFWLAIPLPGMGGDFTSCPVSQGLYITQNILSDSKDITHNFRPTLGQHHALHCIVLHPGDASLSGSATTLPIIK